MHEDWTPIEKALEQETGTTDDELLEDESHRLFTNNAELCSALKAVYALAGEDPQIEKIVHDAIREHGEEDY